MGYTLALDGNAAAPLASIGGWRGCKAFVAQHVKEAPELAHFCEYGWSQQVSQLRDDAQKLKGAAPDGVSHTLADLAKSLEGTHKVAHVSEGWGDEDDTAEFSAGIDFSGPDPGGEGDLVSMVARLSRAGNYPDKGIELTLADFDAAAAHVSEANPVAMNLAHVRRGVPIFNALPGGLGRVVRVWREGQELLGEILTPRWMLSLAKEAGVTRLPLSAEWDATKRLIGCAWEQHPRIHDAQLLAAFTSSSTSTTPQGTPPEMNKFLKALLSLAPWIKQEEGAVAAFSQVLETAGDETDERKPSDFSAEVDPLRTQLANLRSENIKAAAEAYVDKQMRENRVVPAERENVIALFCQAAADDDAGAATVEFTVGTGDKTEKKKLSRLEALKLSVEARPSHKLTEEILPSDATVFTSVHERQVQKFPSPAEAHRMKFDSEQKASGR